MRHAPAFLLALLSTAPLAAQDRPYTEGPVTSVSYIRIKPGMFDKYVKYLDTDYSEPWKPRRRKG